MAGIVGGSGLVATDLSGVKTDNSGTPGNTTLNQLKGRFAVAAAASSAVVTNSNVTTNCIVICQVISADVTAKSVSVAVANGSFTVTTNAATTAATTIDFIVIQ